MTSTSLTDDRMAAALPLVRRVVRLSRVPPWVSYDDVEQDVWLAILPDCVAFDADRGVPWEGYVAQRAAWAARDSVRASYPRGYRRRQVQVQVPLTETSAVGHDETGYWRTLWAQLGARLGPCDRWIMNAKLKDAPQRDIAARLGLSESAVSLRVTHAVAAMRPRYEGEYSSC